jgi:hypothetical protein
MSDAIDNDDPFATSDNMPAAPDSTRVGEGMANALAALPPDMVKRITTIAARYGIRHDADPMWALVEAMQDSLRCAQASAQAAESAAQAADETQIHLAALPGAIQKGVVDGGNDLQGIINQTSIKFVAAATAAVQKAVEQATLEASAKLINDAAKATASIKDVVNDLPSAIKEQRDAAVKTMAECGAAAAQAAVSATKLRGRAWAGFSFLAVLFVGGVLGGFVGIKGGEMLNQIQPIGVTAQLLNVPGTTALSIKKGHGKGLFEVYQH